MRYFISHHQHKGIPIDNALKEAGWYMKHKRVAIALFDHCINGSNPEVIRSIVQKYYDEGAMIVTYPHGATGSWWMDSTFNYSNDHIFANLVIGEGHKHIEEIRQPNLKHYVIGWGYCPLKSFVPKSNISNILFAPIHASDSDNSLREEAIDVNSRVYEALLNLPQNYNITVRHLNPLGNIGLKPKSRIRFVYGKPDGSYSDIDNADIVIAEGTYMYLSVARGKPTIGMNQHIPIRPNRKNEDFSLKNWDKYGEYMAYPIDFYDDLLPNLIKEASNKEASEWKKLFIGNQMDGTKLSILLEDLLNQYILENS